MHDLPLAVALLIVFGSAKLMAELFERLHLPGVVGEIVAGALIGPSVLGWIAPNDTLKVLADLGVLFLLFDAGLQVKPKEFLSAGRTALLVAPLGLGLSLLTGWGVLTMWGASRTEALFLGAAMGATSVVITASTLSSRGLLGEEASKIILAAAVIDDVLGLIVLAVISSLARGGWQPVPILLTAILALAFTGLAAWWGPAAASRILPHLGPRARAQEAQFHIALVLMFALAALAVHAGVAALVGAFLAGLALSESAGTRVSDLTRGVNELLVPFFLVGIGLNLDFVVFRSKSTLTLALIVAAAAIAAKVIGCGAGALRLGARDALRVGAGMIPRGEVSMVVAQMGLSMAVLGRDTYAVIVFMTVVTALIAPLLLRLTFRHLSSR